MSVFIHILSGQQNDKTGIGFRLKSQFKDGDLVSWIPLGQQKKIYGIIVRVKEKTFFNNRVFFTAIIRSSLGEIKEMNLGSLKLESH